MTHEKPEELEVRFLRVKEGVGPGCTDQRPRAKGSAGKAMSSSMDCHSGQLRIAGVGSWSAPGVGRELLGWDSRCFPIGGAND
jgi:hypothetical protein